MRRVNGSEWSECAGLAATPSVGSVGVRGSAAIGLVLSLFWLPLGDGHGAVGHVGGVIPVAREGDVLLPLLVVALGVVDAELGPAGLLALDGANDGALRAVEHVPQLEG